MNWLRPFTLVCVGLACLGLILPSAVLEGAYWTKGTSPGVPVAKDVELDPEGSFRGVVVNVQGVPMAGTSVVVRNSHREVARTLSDGLGCFSVEGLGGGTYQVTTGRYTKQFRTWVACTAPPRTRRIALIVVGDDVVRGQRPLGEFLRSDAVIITGLLGAMIGIPIAVHQFNRRGPTSP